ncbi:Zn-dependent protease [Candidatus Magnetobacterium bavaricum]|uniref:Zn-dependent protease n=1 Tax=Candidatus Magnetobacterium bavaricum TaxID=29290 RepID=A0A0F3GSB9_9BACT|nr:Zn-dependent protease [Candidatus Magnetobacterium bavaricum]
MKTEIAEKVIGYISSLSGLKGEVFCVSSRNISVEAKDGQVEALQRADVAGFSVRVLNGLRQGLCYCNDFSQWKEVADKALEISKWTEPDQFTDYPPGGASYQQVDIYDQDVANATEDYIIERAMEVEREALAFDPKVKKVRKAMAGFSVHEVLIANTQGLWGSYTSTSCSASATVLAEGEGQSQMGWGFETDRFLGAVSAQRVGKSAADRAVKLLGARPPHAAVKSPVILESSIAAEFLEIIASSLSSDNVQKGKSLLACRVGQEIASGNIHIVDNALLPGKTGTRPFDAEGVPSQRNDLVTNGVLNGFLYNTYTARKSNGKSTGNAVKGGISGLPSVGISNLYIEPASGDCAYPIDSLIQLMGRGLLITDVMGVHTANRISGDFSIGASGLWIEHGRLSHPIKEAVISGNLITLLKNISAVGSDLCFYGNIGTPALMVNDVDISG